MRFRSSIPKTVGWLRAGELLCFPVLPTFTINDERRSSCLKAACISSIETGPGVPDRRRRDGCESTAYRSDTQAPGSHDGHQAKGMAGGRHSSAAEAQTLRINAFATAAREVMEPLILSFMQRYPQVHIDLVTEGRIVDNVAAGFDLGLRPADLVPADMIAVPLGLKRSNAVVASPESLHTHDTPRIPPDLYRFRCIRPRLPNNALFRRKFEKDGEAVQIDVQGSISLDESSLVKIAAQRGVGLGYVMEADVRENIAAGRLVRVLADWTQSLAPLALYYPGRKNFL